MEMSRLASLAVTLPEQELLAEESQNLSAMLFQDDLYQQDFYFGAKNAHSFSGMSGCEVSFDGLDELPKWMEADCDIDLDQLLQFGEYFPADLKKQQFYSETDQLPIIFSSDSHDLSDVIVEGKENFKLQHLVPEVKEQPQDIEEKQIFEEPLLSSPLNVAEGISNLSNEAFADLQNQESDGTNDIAVPCIISVPIAEAFVEQKPVVKTIRISSIQPVLKEQPFVKQNFYHNLSFVDENQPQKIIINLKRVSLPSQLEALPCLTSLPASLQASTNATPSTVAYTPPSAVISPPPAASSPTLKELLSSGDADEVIRQLLSPPSSPESDTAETCYSDTCTLSPNSNSEMCTDSPSVHSARHSPYSSEQRKQRKKEQNKRAALRYRQKKKGEEESVHTLLQREEQRQQQLKEKYDALHMEVKLMKKWIREMIVAKKQNAIIF